MPEPLALPIRVLVKGASTVVATSWMGGPRTDLAFPRVIEAELHAAGHPAEVRVTAMPAERVRSALKVWDREILTWSPDVIVLHYGHMECIHLFLPRWLERHVKSPHSRPGVIRERYRQYLLRPLWKVLAQLQARLDRALPPTLLSFRPRRVAADLQRLIEQARTVASPLILIPNILPAGRVYTKWFPGIDPRIEVMNATIAEMVRRLGQPDVRVFRVDEVVAPMLGEGEEAQPDGGHYTPEIHRAVGRAIAEVVLTWAADQPHLDLPQARLAPSRLHVNGSRGAHIERGRAATPTVREPG